MVIEEKAAVAVENKDTKKEDRMAENMKTIQLDSVDYQAEEAVISAYKSEKARADSLVDELATKQKSISTLEAERDSAKERADALEAKVAELEKAKLDEAEINKRVEARIALLALADKAKAEVKADMSDLEIKKAIIMAVYPKTNLDGKDEVYISARVDCASEDLVLKEEKKADGSVLGANVPAVNMDSVDSADAAYKRMLERLQKQGRA